MTPHMPARSGRFIMKGKGDEPLLQLRRLIRAEEMTRMRIAGRVPAQDVDANAPGYTPGLSRKAVQP